MKRQLWYHPFNLGLIALACIWAIGLSSVASRPDGLLHIYFLDVGQGDSILIKTPTGQYALIDGGPDGGVETAFGGLLPLAHRQLDLVLLTHSHADHAAGLIPVVSHLPVGQFWYSGASDDTQTYNELLGTVNRETIPINLANSGDVWQSGEVSLRVISPENESPASMDPNAISIVTELRYRNYRLLLAGDATQDTESTMMKRGVLDNVDTLKVGHHGSRTSTTAAFLQAVHPEIAVVSVGKGNSFGHPAPDTLARLSAIGAQVYRTDQNRTMELVTDGISYRLLPQTPGI